MPDFYTHTTEVAEGSALGTNKGILIKAGTTKTVVTAHAYDGSGATADMEIAVNADESMVVPVEVHTYHTGSNSPKVYRLR